MRILITGGLGYIGGRVADYFKNKESDTQIFLSTKDLGKNMPKWTKRFKVLKMDLLDEVSIIECINSSNPNVIIHLAALNEVESNQNQNLAKEVNVNGTYKLLDYAHKKGLDKFIYFSTFHVYAKNGNSTITEESPTKPCNIYAATHLEAEEVVDSFRKNGVKTLIFRLSNGCGYPMDKNVNRWMLVVNDLCRQVVETNKIVLNSSGLQHRDFITLQDVAKAVYHFIFVNKEWKARLYNLGSGKSISILEIAQKIAQIYEKRFRKKIVITKKSGGNTLDIGSFIYDINKIKSGGFSLDGDMEKEIENTMAVCEEIQNEKQ